MLFRRHRLLSLLLFDLENFSCLGEYKGLVNILIFRGYECSLFRDIFENMNTALEILMFVGEYTHYY